MAKITEILKNRNFLFLWLGQIISQFGDRLTQMALIGLIYKRAPGSPFELAKLFTFVIIPVFVIGPIAGAYSDRWNKKYTMIVSDLVRGILVLLIFAYYFVVPTLKPIFPIYIIVFIIFSSTRFFIPAKMSIIPDLVSEDKLLLANSLITTTGMIAAVLGLGIGGVFILPLFGVKAALLIDAATFFASAVLLWFIKIAYDRKEFAKNIYRIGKEITQAIKSSLFAEIKEGVRYLLGHRKMHFVIGILFLLWSAIGASYPITITFVQDTLGTVTKHLGILIMFFGAGLFVGALSYGKLGHKFSKTKVIFLSLSFSGFVLALFIFCLKNHIPIFVVKGIVALFGLSIAPIMISANTIVHELIPENLRGRAFSSLEAVMHLAFLIFMLLASILAETMDTSHILIAVGALCVCAGVFGLRRARG